MYRTATGVFDAKDGFCRTIGPAIRERSAGGASDLRAGRPGRGVDKVCKIE